MIAQTHGSVEAENNVLFLTGSAAAPSQKHGKSHWRALGLIAKLRATIEHSIPFGYQDETGFHYGTEE